MEMEFIKKVNLVEQLSDAHPSVREPTEGEISAWSEVQIRAHYKGISALTATQSHYQGIYFVLFHWIVDATKGPVLCMTHAPYITN